MAGPLFFGAVDAQTDQFTMWVVIGDAVTIVHGGRATDVNEVTAAAYNLADGFTRKFWGVEGADIEVAGVDEIVGGAAVEGFFRLWGKEMRTSPRRCSAERRQLFEFCVETLSVVGRNVLDVGQILESTLDLERANAGIDQRSQVVALIVVLE